MLLACGWSKPLTCYNYNCTSPTQALNVCPIFVKNPNQLKIQKKKNNKQHKSYFTGCIDKGQLISKCPFGVIVSTKIPTKKFDKFCPRILKSCEINKIKALFYNTIIYTWLYGLFDVFKSIIECLYLMIWPLFKF